jgi:hypothetical protein
MPNNQLPSKWKNQGHCCLILHFQGLDNEEHFCDMEVETLGEDRNISLNRRMPNHILNEIGSVTAEALTIP